MDLFWIPVGNSIGQDILNIHFGFSFFIIIINLHMWMLITTKDDNVVVVVVVVDDEDDHLLTMCMFNQEFS